MTRLRPPTLTIQPKSHSFESESIAFLDTSSESISESPLASDDELLQLSSPSSSSSSSPIALNIPDAEELSRDLAALAQLRQSVQKNLRLRPIRSFSRLPKTAIPNVTAIPWRQDQYHRQRFDSDSSSPKSASSTYLTPVDVNFPPPPASSPPEPPSHARKPPQRSASMPSPRVPTSAMDPTELLIRLASPTRPLLIDTRPHAAYAATHLLGSINIAMPSLILKRSKRTLPTFASLRQFITSDEGKDVFDTWDVDGDVVIVHGEETDERERDNTGVIAWALLSVLAGFLGPDKVWYLRGGIVGAQLHARLRKNIIHAPHPPPSPSQASLRLPKPPKSAKGRAFLQLDTHSAAGLSTSVQIEQEDQGHGDEAERPGHSPLPIMPGLSLTLDNPTDSPPSTLAFRRPPPPRRSSNLILDSVRANGTSDAANSSVECGQTLAKPLKHAVTTLPRLQIHTAPTRSLTLPITPSQQAVFLHPPPASPSHLTLLHSNHTPPTSAFNSSFNFNLSNGSYTGNASPSPPMPISMPMTPSTARPTPTTSTPGASDIENEREDFIISTILPNFLFLGPELILPSHVSELQSLGVKRIINIAAECTDDRGLMLRERFERYVHIPMRDCVEEEGVRKGLSEACDVLDEAALYNAPTYVHCKAGKSRSVTAVMAYLIHSHHWPLARAYQFVLERRKGISPNIGFVSELMAFEEAELGRMTKPKPSATVSESSVGDVGVGTGRRPAHVRESLPPMPSWDREEEEAGEEMGQDMEIRDREGRYRHVRRAPVDENTLQPMRRVSKAGLESAGSTNGDDGDGT
ncbi:hypothetical protein DEU56DRAFT_825804 [Suillus clintonianus]|uniref:uncharacterized protein n=1 Tax=Suillus clintonianus TaxID=1904413 RepID=UPI001B862134|nr:uncharacterized protein DEU56DRAFT_825804 [Suillus clintonianus]KAG2125144.1 hypothetical protein DEU56DRAFT_825804 [Suillus clintonianus]